MTTLYEGDNDLYNDEITTIEDSDEPTGSIFSTPLEQLADNARTPDIVLHAASSSYTVPTGIQYLEIIAIGPGSRGGTNNGGTSTGGAGGGCGGVRRCIVPVIAGMVFTTTVAAENSNANTTVVCATSKLQINAPPGESSAGKTNTPGYGADGGRRLDFLINGDPGSSHSAFKRAGDGDGGITAGVGVAGYSADGGEAGTANAGAYTGKAGYGYGAGGPGQDGSGGTSGGGGGGGFGWISPAGTPVGGAAGNAAVGGAVIFRPIKGKTRAV